MTTVTFHMLRAAALWALMVKGHSGYAGAGEDIVCAAVTSAVRLVECTVNEVLGLGASVKVREKDASHLPSSSPADWDRPTSSTCQAPAGGR